MNLQEAYNKGLDDAEKVAIEKLTNALDGMDDGPFNNPKMEEIRQRIFEYKRPVKIVDPIDKPRLLKVFNSILAGKPSKLEIKDPELQEFRIRFQNVMTNLYSMTTKRTSFAKHMRKNLKKNSSKSLTSEDDVLN